MDTQENLEQKLKEENETNKLLDAEESSGKANMEGCILD
jgi:hypothetical protein